MFGMPSTPEDEKIKWDSTKGDFITFVEFYQIAGGLKVNGRGPTTDKVGNLFLNVIDIGLSPFPDFKTMRIALTPPKDALEAATEVAGYLEHEYQTYDLMEEMNIGPSQEEKVKRMFGWTMATGFVLRLEKYGEFH